MTIKHDFTLTRKMPDRLAKLREDGVFCDVILQSGTKQLFAHRIILIAVSDYFSLLFKYEGGFQKPAINFDENLINGDSLENIINYAYTGQIDITIENVYDLLVAADYFDIKFIKEKCEELLADMQKSEEYFISYENLFNFIWFAAHFNLSSLLKSICAFISEHFMEETMGKILMSLSPHCLLTLLREKDFTVINNGIPADNVDLELLKFISQYSNEHDLTDITISQLLGPIQLSDIENDHISIVVNSCSGLQRNKEVIEKLNLTTLNTEEGTEKSSTICAINRKFSNKWKHVALLKDVGDDSIDIDDRICGIKVYTFTGIPEFKSRPNFTAYDRSSNLADIDQPISIIGLTLQYKSGITVTKGDTPEKAVFPFDSIDQHEFKLGANEVIIKLSRNDGPLHSIRFSTNLKKEFGPIRKENGYHHFLRNLSPPSEFGYFHSFEKGSTINDLKPLWVEYKDPQNVSKNTSSFSWHLLQAMLAQNYNHYDDSDDDRYYPYYDHSDNYYDSSDYGGYYDSDDYE